MEPIIYNNKTIDRGIASSSDFNSLITDIYCDINNLSLYIDDNKSMIDNTASMIRRENAALLSKISELQSSLSDIKDIYKDVQSNLNIRSLTVPINNKESLISLTNCDVDNTYNIVTPSISNIYDKLRLDTTPNPMMAVNITEASCDKNGYVPTIFDSTNPSVTTFDNTTAPELLNMFDGSYDVCFTRVVKSSTATDNDALFFKLEATIPLNSVNNLAVNCIKICPIPKYSIDIMSIEYKDANSGIWHSIPTMPTDITSLEEIPSIAIIMPTVQLTDIRIVFRQTSFERITLNSSSGVQNALEYFYGFQEISVQYLETAGVSGTSFVTKLELPTKHKVFDTIFNPDVTISNFCNQNISYSFRLFKDTDGTNLSNEISFNDPIPLDTDTVYLQTTLNVVGDIIPAINGVHVQYMVK